MKVCCKCQTEKPVTEFHKRGNGYQSVCKDCRRKLDRTKYDANPKRHAAIREARRQEIFEWAQQLKAQPCTDCGGRFHLEAMHWDHLGHEPKLFNVAEAARRGFSRENILAEIAKCELVCANCHAVRTYNRRQLGVA